MTPAWFIDWMFVLAIAVSTLVVTGFFPRQEPIVLRLVRSLHGVSDWWYRVRWMRRRAWEIQHPVHRRVP